MQADLRDPNKDWIHSLMDRAVYDRMRELQDGHWWFRGRRKILAGLIGGLDLPNSAKILEVGCGTGGNLPMLTAFGEVAGLEPDTESRDYASDYAGVPIKGGALPDKLPYDVASFDLICAFDVIEHLDEDQASVTALTTLLKPGGYVTATVPGQPWMWSRHDELHHHKRRYRIGEYRRLFRAAGLTIVKSSYFNTLLFPPIAAVRGFKMLTGSTEADDDMAPPSSMNGLLSAIFGSELYWLQRAPLPFGVSIVIIARRPTNGPLLRA